MNLLILPGNSQSNKPWTVAIKQKLSNYFKETKIIEYKSWQSNDYGKVIDFPVELEKIKKAVAGWDHYCVFAKSVGTALCMYAVHKDVINPLKCIFVGIPIAWLAENNIPIENWLGTYNVPTLVMQQEHDPFGDAVVVKRFVQKIKNVKEYTVYDGNDHKYNNIDEIVDSTKKFIA